MCIGAQSVKFVTGANFKRRDPASLILPSWFETGFVINNGQGCYATITWPHSKYRSKAKTIKMCQPTMFEVGLQWNFIGNFTLNENKS